MNGAHARAQRARGFTLLELMVTVTVMAVLLAIAVPGLRGTIQRNRLSAASNDLLSTLRYARSAALERGQLVSICPSPDGQTCTSAGQAFEAGWVVYSYPAGSASAAANQPYTSTGATLLRVQRPLAGVSIHALQTPVITFGQQGQLLPATALAFLLCSRPSVDGVAASTTQVPGTRMDVNGSGSVTSSAIPAGSPCGG